MNLEISRVEVVNDINYIKVYAIRNDDTSISYEILDTSNTSDPFGKSIDVIARKLIGNYYHENNLPNRDNSLIEHFDSVKAELLSKVVYI